MVKKPRKKAAKAPDNPCLDIALPPDAGFARYFDPAALHLPSLIPDLLQARKIEMRSPPWRANDAFQAQSRIHRPVIASTLSAASGIADKAALDFDKLQAISKQYQIDMQSRFRDLFTQQMFGTPLPLSDREMRPRIGRAEDLGCVVALLQALRDDYGGKRARLGYVVEDWTEEYSPYLDQWIFGPQGEFTGFARVDALNEGLRRCAREGRRGDKVKARLEGFPVEVDFRVTILEGYRDLHYGMGTREQNPQAYYQFDTYQDYAAWESLASYDRTDLYAL